MGLTLEVELGGGLTLKVRTGGVLTRPVLIRLGHRLLHVTNQLTRGRVQDGRCESRRVKPLVAVRILRPGLRRE